MQALPIKPDSAWQSEELVAYLRETTNPLRLSILSGGRPLIVPLWFLVEDNAMWCASKASAHVVKRIGSGVACGFDVSDNSIPYRGVRGQGAVSIVDTDGEAILRRLVNRYLPDPETDFARWLLKGAENEVAIRIEPDWMTAWDFGQRMRDVTQP